MIWAINLITQAKNTGKIKLDPPILASLQSGFENIEAQNRKLLNYSWVNYPLPYTQVIQEYKSIRDPLYDKKCRLISYHR